MRDYKSGLVLISLDPVDADLVTAVRNQGPYQLVEVGYLAKATPSLREAIEELLSGGADSIHLIPVLTGSRRDELETALAEELAHQRSLHPEVDFVPVRSALDSELHAQLLLTALRGQVTSETESRAVPLSALAADESGTVQHLNGGHELVSRLSALGFVPGSPLQIVQNYDVGPLIVSVRGTRIALGREEARRVRVCPSARRRPRRGRGRRRPPWGNRRHG